MATNKMATTAPPIVLNLSLPPKFPDDLLLLAQVTARMHGFEFDAACLQDMRQFITTGAIKLSPEANHVAISEIARNTVRYVELLIGAALSDGIYPSGNGTAMLSSEIFKRIKVFFCPCYPFC